MSDWLIVGSGPSASRAEVRIEDPNVKVIALNALLVPLYRADATFINNYSTFIAIRNHLHKTTKLVMPDPIGVGFRYVPVSVRNLLDVEDVEIQFPGMLQLYTPSRKDPTVACTALRWLKQNGVNALDFCGIDGGYGSWIKVPVNNLAPSMNYDSARRAFLELGDELGMFLKELEG